MSLLRRAVAPQLERRASDPWSIPPPGGALGQTSSAGTTVNDDAALSIITFYAGMRILTDSIAYTPLRTVMQAADGTRQPVLSKPRQILDPFNSATLQQGLSQIVTSLILRGNAYLVETAYDGGMNPIQWRILNPDQVHVSWYGPEAGTLAGTRKYLINGAEWDPSAVEHLTMFMLPNSLRGAGIIEYARNALGVGIALDDVAGEFFRNGVMSTGVIGVDAPLTPEQAKATAEQFRMNHAGVKRAHMPIVLGGNAKYTPLSLTPEDSQFLQSRQFEQGQIATLLGIPPHLLGLVDRTTSWGTGIEVQGRAFVDYTLRPYFERLKALFTRWVPSGQFAEFVTDDITKADTATRYENYAKALAWGWLSKNEVRLRENLPPIPGGDVYYTPIAMAPSSDENGVIVPAAAAPPTPLPSNDPDTGD